MRQESSATPTATIAPSTLPNFHDVLRARARIAPYLPRTLLIHYPALDELLGATVYVKHENTQPVGAFKVRGGLNFMAQLAPEERKRGVITASTGNHALSIAYAAHVFGVPAQVVMPQGANPNKVAAVRALGTEVILTGENFDAARAHAEHLAGQHGSRYVSPVDPQLIAGVATETLEMLEDQPDLTAIFVPVGSGTGAVGACIVAETVSPGLAVIAVQSQAAPAAQHSWRDGVVRSAPVRTFAEGVATGVGFEFTQQRLRTSLRDFLLVSDEEIRCAMRLLVTHAHTLAEGAGAASLAAAMQQRDRFRGQKVGVVLSGGNVEVEHLRRALGGEA